MSELHREVHAGVDVTSEFTALTYNYGGDSSRVVLIRVELGDNVKPVVGGQNYQISAQIDGVNVTPISTILVPVAQTRAILQSRQVLIEPEDVLTVRVLGAAGDDDVNLISFVMDSTPARLTDLTGVGEVAVDHNYGGADTLAIETSGGARVDNALIRVYRKADYDADNRGTAFIVGTTKTDVNGRWTYPLMLDPGEYTLYVYKPGHIQPKTQDLTVS